MHSEIIYYCNDLPEFDGRFAYTQTHRVASVILLLCVKKFLF